MLDEIIAIHQEVMRTTPTEMRRYLFDGINWDSRVICILGSRGVGKTTLMCQYLLNTYKETGQALYISADNIIVFSQGLFAIAQEYFKYGGKALFIDEIHKYPNWSLEIKNIIDTYREYQIVFSASSLLDLKKSKYDLSRRVVYHELKGLSFREYLNFTQETSIPVITLSKILHQHLQIADQFKGKTILKYFKEYLIQGYFPFILEGQQDYSNKVTNVIEKVIYEDIAVVYNLRQTTLPILKKLLWLIATSKGLSPNIDRISKNLRVSREVIYNCLEYLDQSRLINNIHFDAMGMKLIRKPGKIYLENTNLLYAITGDLKIQGDIGVARETFFVNQLSHQYRINLHDHGDFVIDGKYIIEVGGPAKNFKQISSEQNAILAADGIEIGFDKKIPLYLFGFLY